MLPGGGQSGQDVDPDQVEPRWRWEGLRLHPSGEKSPQRVWSSRVECHFTDMDTETWNAGWFPWGFGQGSVQQGSGIWTYSSVF